MAVELASAYVSLSVRTDKIPGQINQALNGAASSSAADKAGSSIGDRLSSAMGGAVKAGAAAAGAAAAGFIGTALTKGFSRLSAIDDAQAKLEGLGHTSAGTAKIMESALASVRGTSYGLGEAATIAASAVAAGIKPGAELTKYLSLTADAATIAGTSLEEMGAIINKVQTKGKAYTLDLNQLAIRGVPIYQWLAQEMNVTQEALSDMVAEGKVDSATYLKVIEQNIGGAAVAGNAVSAAWANTMAAMGRLGEAILKPTFSRTADWLKGAIAAIDDMTDAVKPLAAAFDAKVFDEWAPKIAEGFSNLSEGFSKLKGSTAFQDSLTRTENVFKALLGVAQDLWPSIQSITKSFMEASAALGVSSWQILLTVLEATATIADAVLVPALSALASLMDSNTGAVTALAAAFLAFKTLPGLVKPIGTVVNGVKTAYTNAITPIRGFTDQVRLQQALAAQSGQTVGRFGAIMSTVGVQAQAAAGKLKTFGANAIAALGGPIGVGITAAVLAIPALIGESKKWDRQAEVTAKYTDELALAQKRMGDAFIESAGAIDDSVYSQIGAQVDSLMTKLQKEADYSEGVMTGVIEKWRNLTEGGTAGTDELWANRHARDRAQELLATLDDLKIGNEELTASLASSDGKWQAFVQNLRDAGVSEDTIQGFQELRDGIDSTREVVELFGPQAAGLASAIDELADGAGNADDNLNSLKRVLQDLGILQTDAAAAAADLYEEVEKVARSAGKAAEETAGIGDALFKTDGESIEIDWSMGNARELFTELEGLADQYQRARIAGMDAGEAWNAVGPQVDALREKYRLSTDQMELFNQAAGMTPRDISTAIAIIGADETREALLSVALQVDHFDGEGPAVAKIQVEDMTDNGQSNAVDYLRGIGAEVRILDQEQGLVEVTVESDEALFKLEQARAAADQYGSVEAEAHIDLDKTYFDLNAGEATELIEFLNQQRPSPEADLIIEKLEQGKKVSIEELADLSKQTADPKAFLQGVTELLADAKRISDALDQATVERRARIVMEYANAYAEARAANPNFVGPLAVAGYATGGSVTGPGGPTSDSIPAVLSHGEHVLTASEVEAAGGQGAIYRMRAAIRAGALKFAEGGAVNGIQAALQAGRSVTGNKYVWGGTGPTGFDCSGFVGWLQQIAMGMSAAAAAGNRLYTTHTLMANRTNGFAGLRPGLGPAGTMFQVGVNQDHMAATVGGYTAESGGSHGDSRIGAPAVGARDSQFTAWFHLPNDAVAGWDEKDSIYYRYGSNAGKKRPEWTAKDDLDLQQAIIDVQQAKENRDKVFNNEKKTQADRDEAELKVQKAELKVQELEQKRDDARNWTPDGPAPQAPAMAESYDKDQRERLRAQLAVDEANQRRNEVYADPLATDSEKMRADLDLQDAEEALQEVIDGKDKDKKSDGKEKLDYSLRGSLKRFGTELVEIGVDAMFGHLPEQISGSRWLNTDWGSLIPDEVDGEGSGWLFDKDNPLGVKEPPKSEVDRQLPVTPGAPGWLEGLLKVDDFADKIPKDELERLRKHAPKVFDSGGWLRPGEMAINLSDRPEPIFNSPDQLRQFANQLMPADQVAPVDARIIFNREVNVADLEGFKRELRFEQDRSSRPYRRR